MNELRKLQLVELDILKEFIKVCEKLNLTYYLDSGTLLGCIRHEGFIPWDDDIDVCMFREDYDIFIEKGQKLLPEGLFIQTYKTDKEYTHPFAKIRNSNTTFIESSSKNLNINHGVYIDVFPYDNYNVDKKLRNYIDKKLFVLYNLQINKKYYFERKDKGLKVTLLQLLSDILYSRKSTVELLYNKEKIAKRNNVNESNFVKCYFYSSTSDIVFYRNTFGKGIKKKFEDVYVNVPEKYNEYLSSMYGNYMELPPKDKQLSHHFNEKVDLTNSYLKYI